MIKELLEAEETFVVKFSASWCGPCKMLSSVINTIDGEKLRIVEVDIDSDGGMDMASEYGVRNVPCMIRFDKGVESNRVLGMATKEEVLPFLTSK